MKGTAERGRKERSRASFPFPSAVAQNPLEKCKTVSFSAANGSLEISPFSVGPLFDSHRIAVYLFHALRASDLADPFASFFRAVESDSRKKISSQSVDPPCIKWKGRTDGRTE